MSQKTMNGKKDAQYAIIMEKGFHRLFNVSIVFCFRPHVSVAVFWECQKPPIHRLILIDFGTIRFEQI